MKSSEVQSLLLKALASGIDRRLGRGRHYLAEAVRGMASGTDVPTQRQILAAYWSLVSQGLAYIDMDQPAPENWTLELTPSGLAAVQDQEINPDDPSGYVRHLYQVVPGLPATVRLYIDEAVNTYYRRSYLACTVMLGVAAEAVFFDVAESFVRWADPPVEKLKKLLQSSRGDYLAKFIEFRARLGEQKSRLSADLRDGLDIHLSSVLDLLRTSRNDAGHPTGRSFDRDDCFAALRVFERLVRRMYRLKEQFDSVAPPN